MNSAPPNVFSAMPEAGVNLKRQLVRATGAEAELKLATSGALATTSRNGYERPEFIFEEGARYSWHHKSKRADEAEFGTLIIDTRRRCLSTESRHGELEAPERKHVIRRGPALQHSIKCERGTSHTKWRPDCGACIVRLRGADVRMPVQVCRCRNKILCA
ncbi:hypothetical protein BN2476_110292 [Paraburkholderia piptadeniae]|uniref:Uncharacterized protein n=1 Tax=Paraburkholderia piptadeniae TaxID=1701573 RepID=A0A1N7RQL5_9BURK|nr:hypothetical protein BN2476_110292 [Paraburkholderia piptadeniae]